MTLPPFPVDDLTLDMIHAALEPDPYVSGGSSIFDFCEMYSRLGGSDTDALVPGEDGLAVMRDPHYHPNDILRALIDEIRRLRRD